MRQADIQADIQIVSAGKKKYGGAKAFEMYALAVQKPEQMAMPLAGRVADLESSTADAQLSTDANRTCLEP
ncbi:MAG: hypothetical protein JO058_16180 [Alphaproteobacteria bacterium]|nr:hypothetical protein [Alphaproteobacteria bacterium]